MLKLETLNNYYNDFVESLKIEIEEEDLIDIDQMIHEYNLSRLQQ